MVICCLLGREVVYGAKRGEPVARMKRLAKYWALLCDCVSCYQGRDLFDGGLVTVAHNNISPSSLSLIAPQSRN